MFLKILVSLAVCCVCFVAYGCRYPIVIGSLLVGWAGLSGLIMGRSKLVIVRRIHERLISSVEMVGPVYWAAGSGDLFCISFLPLFTIFDLFPGPNHCWRDVSDYAISSVGLRVGPVVGPKRRSTSAK